MTATTTLKLLEKLKSRGTSASWTAESGNEAEVIPKTPTRAPRPPRRSR